MEAVPMVCPCALAGRTSTCYPYLSGLSKLIHFTITDTQAMTLLQCIKQLLTDITITDKQTSTVSTTYNNLKTLLLDADNKLYGERVFQNGSYDRDTIIKPLDDVDIFLVLDRDEYEDGSVLRKPQTVLTKLKDFLNGTRDYKDKAVQDRPCVTIHLSDKRFDVLPCFGDDFDGYWIPDSDLSGWVWANPVLHSEKLTEVNKLRQGRIVPLIRILKYWNREQLGKIIPSYHIEDIATEIFTLFDLANHEEGVHRWFQYAATYLDADKFPGEAAYEAAFKQIDKAHTLYEDDKEAEAIKIWKEVFGAKFPTISDAEARELSDSMRSGKLKIASTGLLGALGERVPPTAYFGDEAPC
jgi:Second Messenger Oligonucleotide or Dinucleotide Synthetase domain